MKDIQITSEGDIILDDYEPVSLNHNDTILQTMYTALRTYVGSWRPSPRIGSRIETFHGKIITMELAERVANEVEDCLNNHPAFIGSTFLVSVKKVKEFAIHLSIKMTVVGITTDIEAVIDPFRRIYFKIATNETIDEILEMVQEKWPILNRGE